MWQGFSGFFGVFSLYIPGAQDLIEYKETEQTVGIVSLINIDYKNRSAECIIDIGIKDVWGKDWNSSYVFNTGICIQ